MKLILINGADRAGKDTLAEMLEERCNAHAFSLAEPVKRVTRSLIEQVTLQNDHKTFFEGKKDESLKILNGHTPRDLWIKLAEDLIKPIWGDDIFAKILSYKIKCLSPEGINIIIPDCRFKPELDCFKHRFGAKNITLIHLVNPAQSTIASGDGLLMDDDVWTHIIEATSIEELKKRAANFVQLWGS